MANPEHLEKLHEGVEAWNKWRKDNSDIIPDLRSADLEDADLSNADLMGVNLMSANLSNADLMGVNLMGAYLRGADLRRANLSDANLSDADLYGADLYGANLSSADLSSADLYGANLYGADLYGAKLIDANLNMTQALYTNFEGANLTGACIEDWNINSKTNLENVKCDYIFLKYTYLEEEGRWVFIDRIPHDPDKIFAPGEFTKRYQKILETVDLYFGEGIDWQVFLQSFQKLQEEEKLKIQNGDLEIPIVQGIKNTGDGSFVIEIGVSPDTDKGEWEKSFWQQYQPMLEAQEEKYKLLLDAKDGEIERIYQQNTQLMKIVELKASQQIQIFNSLNNQQENNNMNNKKETKIEKYFNTKQAGIVNNEGEISGNAKVAVVINEAAQQDLTQAAAEIQKLLKQLEKDNPTETTPQKMTVGAKLVEEISNNPDKWHKVIKVIKAMGVQALADAVDNPIFNIAKAGIETALE